MRTEIRCDRVEFSYQGSELHRGPLACSIFFKSLCLHATTLAFRNRQGQGSRVASFFCAAI